MSRTISFKVMLAGAAALTLAQAMPAAAQAPGQTNASTTAAVVPQADVSDVAVMPPSTPHWVYIPGSFTGGGVRIFDGDTAKMKGTIEVAPLGDLGLDPLGRNYYVAETIWSKINRGVRQDMVSIYDVANLKLLTEVPLPARLLGGTANQNFAVSSDGHYGFVYTLQPSSAIEVVDLAKRKFAQTVQIPGCAAVFPAGRSGVGVLCSDGSLATVDVAGGKAAISHTAPFFAVATDPVFDTISVDRKRQEATLLSYTGKVYTAALGDQPKVGEPWSIQRAAGMREGVPEPLNVNWLPGGREPFAVNHATGRMYVLMHVGEQWSHKEPGEEIWIVDLASRKVILRHATPDKVGSIQVSQDLKPLVYVSGRSGDVTVLDGATLETTKTLAKVGGGAMSVVDPS